jgi:hypothetical protein
MEPEFAFPLHPALTALLSRGEREPEGASFQFVEIQARSLAASQAYALLQSQAIQKASMFSSLLAHWCAITGEPLSETACLQLSVSPLTPPVQPR